MDDENIIAYRIGVTDGKKQLRISAWDEDSLCDCVPASVGPSRITTHPALPQPGPLTCVPAHNFI